MKSHLRNNKGMDRAGPKSYILENIGEGAMPWSFCEHWLFSEINKKYQDLKQMHGYLDTLQWAIDTLEHSPTGRLLLQEIMQEGWSVGFADLDEKDFILNVRDQILMLDDHALGPAGLSQSDYFCHEALINLIRALRDIGHETRHGGFDEDYGPEDILMLERVRAADCHAIAALIGWELRGAGMPELWRSMIGAQDGDIALAYSSYMEQHPLHSFSKKALNAAFHQWFACEDRINGCDHATLEHLDQVLRDSDRQNPFGGHRLMGTGIEVLSCMPDKSAYLKGQGELILRDPAYAGLDDEYNQAHFMQLMHDLQAVIVNDIPFRDAGLAQRLFPAEFSNPASEKV